MPNHAESNIPALSLAGVEVTEDEALQYLDRYAVGLPATVCVYDYGGKTDKPIAGSNTVTYTDIARLVIINANLRARDVVSLMNPIPASLWAAVPLDADFRDLPEDPTGLPLYEALTALYRVFRVPGIKNAKATKLLHLKRPGLVPIIDSVATKAYAVTAQNMAAKFVRKEPMYWAAVWRDARSNAEALDGIRADLVRHGHAQALVARLPLLRLHDILVWSRFSGRAEPGDRASGPLTA